MKRYYSYAGIHLCIIGPDEYMYENDKTLASFRCDYLENCHTFVFEVVDELEKPKGELIVKEPSFIEYLDKNLIYRYVGSVNNGWKNAYMCVSHDGMNHHVKIKKSSLGDRIGTHVVYRAIDSVKLILDNNGLLLHSSYIEYKGKSILFTAPSGTGKSTQADLWNQLRGARIINGDRSAILVRDEIITCGVPFAGSSNISLNVTCPLQCIVYLSQGKHTRIRKMKGYEAFRALWEGVGVNTWDKNQTEKVSDLLLQVLSKIPVYHLECTPDESAVIALESVLERENYDKS